MFPKLKQEIKELWTSVRKSGTFGSNLAITSAGSSSAYILGFLLSPILARIYQPEAYGLYALFNAFVTNITIVAGLDYINAFLLPKTRREFIPLFQLALVLIGIVVLVSTGAIILFKTEIQEFF